MANTIKAVIYDMGGVILKSEDYAPRITLAKTYGLSRQELEDQIFDSETAYLATIGKISERDHWKRVFDVLHVPLEQQQDFENAFWAGDRLDTELIDFLDSLRPEIKTALLSNAWTGTRQSLFEKYGSKDVFDISVFSYEVRLAKPDPAIYRLMLSRLEIQPEEGIFLDDNLQNIEAANLLGIHGIHFKGREQAIREIRALL
jgi:epoxide hydrolase-like predicted phosphatase